MLVCVMFVADVGETGGQARQFVAQQKPCAVVCFQVHCVSQAPLTGSVYQCSSLWNAAITNIFKPGGAGVSVCRFNTLAGLQAWFCR